MTNQNNDTENKRITKALFDRLDSISSEMAIILQEVTTALGTKDYVEELIEENTKKYQRKSTELEYNKKANIVKIFGSKDDFNKDYLKYLLEYLEIPTNAQIIFENKD